ncbi:uncharacterized protein LOC131431101 [Malaya genurostris]|uniref:uncharacterized protein LOC131431101 n=1 Tax=Malaya genurostris TaxID=325434 RepID=UPI0026F3ED38|nr:uncharacterized protein LOC131431101 [Malaya genurostris]
MSGFWKESTIYPSEDSEDDLSEGQGDIVRSVQTANPRKLAIENFTTSGVNPPVLDENARAKWLAGSWPLKPFAESLPITERKAEWIRFRDQFERIVSCKTLVDPITKLTGLKIFAGDYLLSIIELQEKLIVNHSGNVYSETILALNNYFNGTCDVSKERMKFREMRMKTTEPFVDWILRLENQAKFCEFSIGQREEEFIQAVVRRSIPDISKKLYEISNVFNNSLEKIIDHGKHLDYIRAETEDDKNRVRDAKSVSNPERESMEETEVKSVNAVKFSKFQQAAKPAWTDRRFEPYRSTNRMQDRRWDSQKRVNRDEPTGFNCKKCGQQHGPRQCKAFRVRCFACKRFGHFAKYCSPPPDYATSNKRENAIKSEVDKINQVDN